jgi:RHS repeat-associated protein
LQTANSWTRQGAVLNNFLGNGGTELNATTSLYDLDWRNYDPALGRLNQVDLMADKYGSLSPYHYSYNNPVGFNDPSGLSPITDGTLIPGDYIAGDQARAIGGGGGDGSGQIKSDGSGGLFLDENGDGIQNGGEVSASISDVRAQYGWSAYSSTTDPGQIAAIVSPYLPYNASDDSRSMVADWSGQGFSGLKATFYQVDKYGNWFVPYTNQLVYSAEQNSLELEQSSIIEQNTEESNPLLTAANGMLAVTGLAVDHTKDAMNAAQAGFKGVKVLSTGVVVVTGAIAASQLIPKVIDGTARPSDYARAAGAGLIIGSGFIPGAGPFISFGLGMGDATGAYEGFYQSFDTPGDESLRLSVPRSVQGTFK